MNGQTTTIKARTSPRDLADVLISLLLFMPLYFVPVFILPSALAILVSGSLSFGLAIFLIIYFVWLAFTVWSLRLSEKGIQFVRLFGVPKFIPWEEVLDLSEASRREIVLSSWLAPRFPAREMTPCLSALHHFRIRWRTGWCYFPPEDVNAFQRLVSEFRVKGNRPGG